MPMITWRPRKINTLPPQISLVLGVNIDIYSPASMFYLYIYGWKALFTYFISLFSPLPQLCCVLLIHRHRLDAFCFYLVSSYRCLLPLKERKRLIRITHAGIFELFFSPATSAFNTCNKIHVQFSLTSSVSDLNKRTSKLIGFDNWNLYRKNIKD